MGTGSEGTVIAGTSLSSITEWEAPYSLTLPLVLNDPFIRNIEVSW